MSIEAMVWALKQAPVEDASALLVLLGLANHADCNGKDMYPSRDTLAAYARCSVRTVAVKLKALEDGGVIVRGDQQKVAHIRADRRPIVYDMNYDVQILHPVGSGYDEQMPSPRSAPREANDVQTTVSTAGRPASNDVQTPAHKPSITILEPSSGVASTSPEGAAEANDYDTSVMATRKIFGGKVGWHPSREVWEVAKAAHPTVELHAVVLEYIQKKRSRREHPDENVWLSWVAQQHKNQRDALAKIEAEQKAKERVDAGKWWPGD